MSPRDPVRPKGRDDEDEVEEVSEVEAPATATEEIPESYDVDVALAEMEKEQAASQEAARAAEREASPNP